MPSQAVQISQRGPFVFVVKPDGTLDQRAVQPGPAAGRAGGDQRRAAAGRERGDQRSTGAGAGDEGQRAAGPGLQAKTPRPPTPRNKLYGSSNPDVPYQCDTPSAPGGPRDARRRARGSTRPADACRPRSAPDRRGKDARAASSSRHSGGLSEPFIRRPVMTVLLSLSIIAFGILTYKLLSVNDLPAVDYPVINVSCAYPGASPETMANNIATPLEKQFLQIPGLALITSSSTQSNTSLTLQFDLNKTLPDAATDVQAAIQRATGQLPVDLPSPPTFTKTNPNDQADHAAGAGDGHAHRRQPLQVRQHGRRPADFHPQRCQPGAGVRGQGRDPHQGGPRRAREPGHHDGRSRRRDQKRARRTPARASSTARTGRSCSSPTGSWILPMVTAT